MKNKLTGLSILLFIVLLTMGAFVVFVNPFNLLGAHSTGLVGVGSAANSNSGSGHGLNSGLGLSQSPTGSSSAFSGTNHDGSGGEDDGGNNSYDDGGSYG